MTDYISAKIKKLEEKKTELQNIECFIDEEHERQVDNKIESIQNEIDFIYDEMDEQIINSF